MLRKLFYSIVERDGLLALQFLAVIEADRKLCPDRKRMAPQRLVLVIFPAGRCQAPSRAAAEHLPNSDGHPSRAGGDFVDRTSRADRRTEQARGNAERPLSRDQPLTPRFIVAEVPMQIGALAGEQQFRRRRTRIATSAPWRPR